MSPLTLAKPPEKDPRAAAGDDSKLATLVRRHPRRWFWATLLVALLLGTMIGAAAGSNQAQLDKLTGQLEDARGHVRDVSSDLATTRTDLAAAEDAADGLQSDLDAAEGKVERLTARGEVPDLTGGSVGDARKAAADYDWRIKTVSQATSAAEPGTIVAQSPREGTVLRNGRSVTLTIARKPPPRWKTIYSFSGSGSRKSDEFTIPRGVKVRISYSFSGDTNAILSLGVPGDEWGGELLLNEIGDYSDTTRVYGHEGRRFLDVEGGSWNVNVQAFK